MYRIRDMWKRLFEDCNKKQGEEIERLRREYKERSERLSQTTETRLPATTGRVTIPDPSDTLGDPFVEQTVRKLIETAGRLVANRNAPGSGVTAPYGAIDDTGRVQLSQETMTRTGVSDTTLPTKSSKVPDRKIREMPMKKVSRVIDVQKNNQLEYSFTGVPDTDLRACLNRSTWSAAVNLQQPPQAEMRKAKIMIVASSDLVYISKSLFWPDVILLAAVDLDLMQSVSMAIGVQRQTEMNPIKIVFAGMNDHLHSRGFLSRLREPTTAEEAVWPAIKDILESMGEVVDTLKEGAFTKITPRAVFALSPGYAHLPDGLKFV